METSLRSCTPFPCARHHLFPKPGRPPSLQTSFDTLSTPQAFSVVKSQPLAAAGLEGIVVGEIIDFLAFWGACASCRKTERGHGHHLVSFGKPK